MADQLKVGLVTKEWPPFIYGGAGVHVKYLTQSLRRYIDVDVHCFGEPRTDATAYPTSAADSQLNPAMQALITDAQIADHLGGVQIVHSHTWYANMAGHFAKLLHGAPHVITAHSLEPDRPPGLGPLPNRCPLFGVRKCARAPTGVPVCQGVRALTQRSPRSGRFAARRICGEVLHNRLACDSLERA